MLSGWFFHTKKSMIQVSLYCSLLVHDPSLTSLPGNDSLAALLSDSQILHPPNRIITTKSDARICSLSIFVASGQSEQWNIYMSHIEGGRDDETCRLCDEHISAILLLHVLINSKDSLGKYQLA